MDYLEEDLEEILKAYFSKKDLSGMIQSNEDSTKGVRAVFFVDPKGIIRAIMYHPLSPGRNFEEL